MSVWQTGLMMWSVAGFAMVTAIDFAMRHEADEGLLFGHKSKSDAIAGLMTMIFIFVAWPVVIVMMVILAMRDGGGELAHAPLKRAPEPEPPAPADWPNPSWVPPESDEELLCRMIRLRLMKDKRLAGQPTPHRWPRESLWQTTEATLLAAVRTYLELNADGLSPDEIRGRIHGSRETNDDLGPNGGLRAHIKRQLRTEGPAYLALGRAVFNPAALLAIQHTRGELDRRRDLVSRLQPEWLTEPLSPVEVERAFEGLMFPTGALPHDWRYLLAEKRREWRVLKVRMAEGDVLRRYQADDADGDHGLALVRSGRPIGYIVAIRGNMGDDRCGPNGNPPSHQ